MVVRLEEYEIERAGIINERRSCRACKHFVRVSENDGKWKIYHRGFCILGQLQGDFSLYVSWSGAERCPAFVFDEYNAETYKVEQELSKEWSDFAFKLEDRRTKVYKEFKEFAGALAEAVNLKEFASGKVPVNAFFEARRLAYEFFVKKHRDKFLWLKKRKLLPYREYVKILTTLSSVFESKVREYFGEVNSDA